MSSSGKSDSRHYSETAWVDFVRGLLSAPERETMQEHLEAGCAECAKTAALLAKVTAHAGADGDYEPPDYAVHYARSLFRLQQPEEVRFRCLMAKIVYDSFREPLFAGMRNLQQMTRQVLYEAGSYYLDFCLEHKQGNAEISLLGQITDRERPDSGMANVPVLLLVGESVVAEARTNTFGEFRMQYKPARSLRLYSFVRPGVEGIQIQLGNLISLPTQR
jgi:hypothetical protein